MRAVQCLIIDVSRVFFGLCLTILVGPFCFRVLVMDYAKTLDQLKTHEGLRLNPYPCTSGRLTIGYGRNLDDKGITESEAEEMLISDVAEVEHSLHMTGLLTNHNDARKAVLVNMGFNLGVTGLLRFTRMIAAYRKHDYDLAAKEMLDSRWAMQVHKRAVELAEQMRSGEFQ